LHCEVKLSAGAGNPNDKLRDFRLSPSAWTEILYALDQDSTGARTRISEKQLISEFTDADWLEIYTAVEAKLVRMKSGHYGTDSVVCRWRRELQRILAELDEIGAQYIGGVPCE
jgi:hypothetical protein